ncbi:DUF397 domain-containing protein [Streptomyces buecherae]|uniref:DUF397 domain-containing protein n=1 Tax=Streptomyces buecherae TaxID=2763006 RepID=UPI00369C2E40
MMTHTGNDKWVSSTHSTANGQCVQWAPARAATTRTVPVRDSKDPSGPALAFDAAAWTSFIDAIKAGDFDA